MAKWDDARVVITGPSENQLKSVLMTELLDALQVAGFLITDDNGGLRIHDWQEYSGVLEEAERHEVARVKNRERQQRYRDKEKAKRNVTSRDSHDIESESEREKDSDSDAREGKRDMSQPTTPNTEVSFDTAEPEPDHPQPPADKCQKCKTADALYEFTGLGMSGVKVCAECKQWFTDAVERGRQAAAEGRAPSRAEGFTSVGEAMLGQDEGRA